MTKILDVAMADGRFYTLIDALKAANLIETLEQTSPFTLLAPTDEAFALLQPQGVSALLADTVLLNRILAHHVIAGKYSAAELLLLPPRSSLVGQPLSARIAEDVLYIEDSRVLMRDIEGDDGIMHALDKLLIPV